MSDRAHGAADQGAVDQPADPAWGATPGGPSGDGAASPSSGAEAPDEAAVAAGVADRAHEEGGQPEEDEAPEGEPSAEQMREMAEAFADADADAPMEDDSDAAAAAVEVDLDLARTAAERDEYLDALRRLQADFENYKKRVVRQQTEALERAGEDLVSKLLPVLDTIDLARRHGAGESLEQVATALFDVLGKEGLERVDPAGEPFDPTEHDAVAHEEGDGGPAVAEVLRAGYRWRGRLLRPAMVKVQG